MTVILMALKVLGITVLILLGLFLTAVLAVLFVPVRYRADGSFQEELTASARITWLLHLISIRIVWEKELSIKAFLCGIPIEPGRARKESQASRQKSEGGETAETVLKEQAAETLEEPSGTEPAADAAEPAADSKADSKAETRGEPEKAPEKTGWEKAVQKLQTFSESLREIRSAGKRMYDRLSFYRSIWDREETRRAFGLASGQLCKTVRHVLPRRMDVSAVIGTGDPASTGQILAVWGMLYPWLGSRVQIVPDFEEEHFEGEFHLRGHIRAGVLGFYGLRLMLDGDVRRLIRILRGTADKEENNGRKQRQ